MTPPKVLPKLAVAFVQYLVADAFGKVCGQEEREEVGIGSEFAVAEDVLIDRGVVLDERPFVVRDGVLVEAIYAEGLLDGVGGAYLLVYAEHVGPVLALALQGHEHLWAVFGVVDGREEAYFVVALGVGEGLFLGCDNDAVDGSFLVASVVACEGECIVMLLHECNLLFQFLGEPAVVAVAESEVASASLFDALVSSCSGALVLFEEEAAYAGILGDITLDDFLRVVAGAVVCDDEFPVLICLRYDAVYACRNVFSAIVGGHDDRNKFFHVVSLPVKHSMFSNAARDACILPT